MAVASDDAQKRTEVVAKAEMPVQSRWEEVLKLMIVSLMKH